MGQSGGRSTFLTKLRPPKLDFFQFSDVVAARRLYSPCVLRPRSLLHGHASWLAPHIAELIEALNPESTLVAH